MYPRDYAQAQPELPAVIMAGSGLVLTYGELETRANQGAHLLRVLGLRTGDVMALLLENGSTYFEIAWAAQRAGLYLTAISTRLNVDEVAYILADSGARVLVASAVAGVDVALRARLPAACQLLLAGNAAPDGWDGLRGAMPVDPIADEASGSDLLYSSGTTGRPKGVKHPLSGVPLGTPPAIHPLLVDLFGLRAGCVYLSPAPLYHAAPLRWTMTVHRLGGTVVQMERFDAEQALSLIERHRCDCGQFVPTHFVRMLKLPKEMRATYDLLSMRTAVHAAAPCSVDVKRQMLAWWGPVLYEYYSGTELNGMTFIRPAEWLDHPGSVGRAVLAEVRICGEDGEVLPPRREGVVYFANGPALHYHNAPELAGENTNRHGWTTLGDVGWIDEEGYLYLTDRKSFMIISGGVNVYPQEVENAVLEHPAVLDAAVVGAPDEEMGERVVCVVEPVRWEDANEDLRRELSDWARARVSHLKAPREIHFMRELPRQETGKLFKRLIRDRLWNKEGAVLAHPLV